MKIDKDESARVGIKVLRGKTDSTSKNSISNKKKTASTDFAGTEKSEKFFKRNEIDD